MRAAVLLAALGIAAATPAPAADPANWVCVPGDNGRWRCGQGGAELETSPLPELVDPNARTLPTAPADGATRAAPSIFILDRPGSRASPLELPAPDSATGAAPLLDSAQSGAFALKIATVSRVEEIPGFVDSFGLDPGLVRYVEIEEAGASRQVVLWGAFSSAEQARRAVAGLPGVVRSMRPQIVRADGFVNPPRALLAADRPDRPSGETTPLATAPDPGERESAAEDPEPPSRAQAAAEPPVAATATESGAREPDEEPSPTRPAPVPAVAASESKPDGREPTTEPAEPPARTRPAAEPAVAAADPDPGTREPAAESAEIAPRPRPGADPNAVVATEPSRHPRPPTTTTMVTAPADAARSGSAPADRAPARETPATITPPGRGPEAFRKLSGDAYTVQLTSLRDADLIARYLHRHQLDPGRVYRLRVDEGAGLRWLLLWGAYPSLEQAEAARAALPASVRSPWVRRIQPLTQRLGLQSDP